MGYEVKKGDGWYRIAKNLGIDVNELLALNNANLNTALHPGQRLITAKKLISKKGQTDNPYNAIDIETAAANQNVGFDWMSNFTDNAITRVEQEEAARKQEEEEIRRKGKQGTKGLMQQTAKENVVRLQRSLMNEGYDLGPYKDDGNWGGASERALQKALSEGWEIKDNQLVKKQTKTPTNSTNPVTRVPFGFGGPEYAVMALGQHHKNQPNKQSNDESWQTIKQVGSNFVRNPLQTGVDVALYTADKMGAPTNATNYLRDLNVSIPYRVKNALHAGYKTIMGDKSFKENYDELLANPGWYTDFSTIRPLTNTNTNFSNEELQVIRDAAGEDFQIDNADIKRVSEDGKYGKNDALTKYFSPSKVFQTAIGQSSGNSDDKVVTDVFDVNTVGDRAQRDNDMYLKEAKKNIGPNYATMRASMPYLNMIDIMPNKFKIHTRVKFNE